MVKHFGNLLTAMVTPFDDKMEVDYTQAANLAKYLAEHGSDGIVVCGTTGESPTLTKEEKIKLWQVVKEAVAGKAVVIAGTGSNNTKESIAMTKEAEKIGVDGAMLVGPYYNKPSQEGFYQHFKTVAESTSLPIIVYNVPGRTGTNILPQTVIRLSEIPNIVAVKEASGNVEQASQIRRGTAPDFMVYSGDDSLTLPILAVGGTGVISVASHVIGDQMQEMIKAYLSGDVKKASALHLELFPVFKGLFITSNPVPVKAALNLKGIKVGSTRLPLVDAAPEHLEAIKGFMQPYL
ncbi:MAG: 4-hydroxy-tetrahydrodipicolinate synthase [bacterium]